MSSLFFCLTVTHSSLPSELSNPSTLSSSRLHAPPTSPRAALPSHREWIGEGITEGAF